MAIDISDVLRRVVYAPNGVGPYQFTFEILTQTDIDVYKGSTLLTLTTDYTVSINANGTGSVTLVATAGTSNITIVGARGIARTTDFVTGGDLLANSLNDELDAQTIFAQQTYELGLRALKAPVYDPTDINMTLPTKATRANKTLTFDADGNPAAGVSAADVANAVTYATNAANSATAAAASASAASSSASSASSSASTATTQASNASTSATNAANSASAASTSATNAASSASTAATQASNASTSATNAASSASAASTSASNAATSATNASNSASSASTSATNASNSATAAANSATAAAASASAAANTFDSFDDRYLGTKASNPTVDNDGNALVAGALYFSTSENIMKVYDGASWIAATSAGNVSFLRYRYVATSGQTTFSGSDSNAATLSYTVNNIVVFLNGVSLDQTEYTATSGTSVVLGTGAALNDELVIVAFKSFVTADMVPASTGGTYAGAVRFAAGSASVPSISVDGDTNTGVYFPAADTIAFTEGGVESMRLNSSGNMGLGVTPSAWNSSAKVLDISTTSSVVDFTSQTWLVNNLFLNSSSAWIYKTTNFGSLFTQAAGDFIFYRTASGTAGATATLQESMRITSSGNVGIGTTTPLMGLDLRRSGPNVCYGGLDGNSNQFLIRGNLYYDNTNARSQPIVTGWQTQIQLDNNSGFISFATSTSSVAAGSASTITERARITSGGYSKFSNDGSYISASDSYHEFTNTANLPTLFVRNTNASQTDVNLVIRSTRAATSAYNFLSAESGNGGDTEFRLRGDGNGYADGTWNNNGADYAEFFESATGAALTLGATVVLEGNKVREATDQDPVSAIMGVVRPKEPSKASMVVGNTAWNKWANKYLTDDFDRYIMEDHDVLEWTDEEGKLQTYESHNIPAGVAVPDDAVVKTHDDKGNKFQHYKLNPAWNPDAEYINRENRPEWIIVGLVGQVKILKGQPVNDRWIKMRDVSETVEEWMIR